jgi:hypothetical protein
VIGPTIDEFDEANASRRPCETIRDRLEPTAYRTALHVFSAAGILKEIGVPARAARTTPW